MAKESPFNDPSVKEKAKQTFIERYGVDNPFDAPEIREKIRQTNIKKYGVDNPSKNPEVIERIKQSQRKTFDRKKQEKYDALPFVVPDWDAIWGTRTMSEAGIKLHYPKFYNYILENYPADIPFKERLWMYIHNATERPVCKVCGKPVSFKGMEYATYCSSKCCNSDPEKISKTKDVMMEKYGVDNASLIPGVAEKKKKTCEMHYDGGYGSKEISDKCKKTCLERYGVEHYGNLEKRRETSLKRYGVEHWSQSKEIMEKKRQTNLEHFGLEWSCQLPQARVGTNNSKPNKLFEKILKDNDIDFEREFPIENRSYDFKIGNTLIEIDPTATHNSSIGIFKSIPTDKAYHKNKTLLAEKYGYHCIHIWDWDDIGIIVDNLKKRETIYARNTEIRHVDRTDCDEFLINNHLQGTCKGQKHIYGLYHNDELVMLMTFGKPRYNKNYEYELLRLCTKCGYMVVGGAEKLFSHFLSEQHPESIVSYCDHSKFSGDVYCRLGFEKTGRDNPSKHWVSLKTGQHITDNLLRQRGFDQLFKTDYGKGTSNEELMLQHGFVIVYDCGQVTYVYKQKDPSV